MDSKRRRKFFLYDKQNYPKAMGLLYDEGNVQVLWRSDSGWTAEQYASIALVLDLMPGVKGLRFE